MTVKTVSPQARLGRTTELTVPALVVATTSERRVEAWRALLDEVAASRRAGPLLTHVATWPAWTARAAAPFSPDWGVLAPAPALAPLHPEQERPPWTSAPWPIVQREAVARVEALDLAPCQRAALDLLGRHPFLPACVLADVLGPDARSVRSDLAVLVQRGLARVVLPEELPEELPRAFASRCWPTSWLDLMAARTGQPSPPSRRSSQAWRDLATVYRPMGAQIALSVARPPVRFWLCPNTSTAPATSAAASAPSANWPGGGC